VIVYAVTFVLGSVVGVVGAAVVLGVLIALRKI
jgi:hypothetical protein